MSQEHKKALRDATKALIKSMASVPASEKDSVQDAIDKIQDELDNLVVDDLLKCTQAVRRAADEMDDVLDTINTHASGQIKAGVQDALTKLKSLDDASVA